MYISMYILFYTYINVIIYRKNKKLYIRYKIFNKKFF